MHFQTVLLSALAALATASPALDARGTRCGRTLDSNQVYLAELQITGGCVRFGGGPSRPVQGSPGPRKAAYAEIYAGIRCRFYRYVFLYPCFKTMLTSMFVKAIGTVQT
jgi:hypothetical protein